MIIAEIIIYNLSNLSCLSWILSAIISNIVQERMNPCSMFDKLISRNILYIMWPPHHCSPFQYHTQTYIRKRERDEILKGNRQTLHIYKPLLIHLLLDCIFFYIQIWDVFTKINESPFIEKFHMKFMNECLRVYRRTTKTFLVGQNWVDSLDKRTFFKYWIILIH